MKKLNNRKSILEILQSRLNNKYGRGVFKAAQILLLFGCMSVFASCAPDKNELSTIEGENTPRTTSESRKTNDNTSGTNKTAGTGTKIIIERTGQTADPVIPLDTEEPFVMDAFFAKKLKSKSDDKSEEEPRYKEIKEANVGETVYVFVDTINLNGKNVNISILDKEGHLTKGKKMEKVPFKDSKDGIFSGKVGDNDFAIFEICLRHKEKDSDGDLTKEWRKICRKQKTQFAIKVEVDAEKVIYCGQNNEGDKENNIWLNQEGRWFKILFPCFCNREFTDEELEEIIKELRDNTYYNNKPISTFHGCKLFYQEEGLPVEDRTYTRLAEVLNKTFYTFEINTCVKKTNFLAQMYMETAYYTDTKENGANLSYDPYRGRGFIQLTHKGNEDTRTLNATSYLGYKKYSDHDVITDPDLISNSLDLSADSGGWFWKYGVRKFDGNLIDLNSICSDTEASVKDVTYYIKGSSSGYKGRYICFKELIKIFDCQNRENNN